MKDIKIKYLPSDLWHFFKSAVKSLATGLCRIVWVVILFAVNIVLWAISEVKELIRKSPVISVCVTFVIMLVVAVGVHMQMKAKLTTAEWQRDSLEQKLDSIKVLSNTNNRYYRYQRYNPE